MSPLPSVIDAAGRPVPLSRELARGGEGTVYTLANDPGLLAKVYLDGKAPPADKFTALLSVSSPALLRMTAWPRGVLFHPGPGRRLAGFLMGRLTDCQPIQRLANPGQRLQTFPRAGWRFQVRAAANLAAAVDEVHKAGWVIGDVNESNALVSPQALVWLIDCDSFQIRAGGRDHLCEVGKEFYIPPELLGRPLTGVVRTPNHDRYGLAVLIYQLLFVGRHPYSGLHDDDDDHTRLIRDYRFAQGPNAHRWRMRPPPHCPTFDDIPPDLRTLFCKAFERGGETGVRPTAIEWCQALGRLAGAITTCRTDDGHEHWSGATGCVWCRIERTGPPYYLGVGTDTAGFAVDEARLQQALARLEAAARSDFPFDRRAFAPPLRPAGHALPAELGALLDRRRAAEEQRGNALRARAAAEAIELQQAEKLSDAHGDALVAEHRRLLADLDERIRRREKEVEQIDWRAAEQRDRLVAEQQRAERRIARDYQDEMAAETSARVERRLVAGVLVGLVVAVGLSALVGLPAWVYLVFVLGAVAMAFVWTVLLVVRSPSAEGRLRQSEYARLRDRAWQQHTERVRAAARQYKAEREDATAAVDDLQHQRDRIRQAGARDRLVAALVERARAAASEATSEVERQQAALVRAAEQEYAARLKTARSDRTQRAEEAERRVDELSRNWQEAVRRYHADHQRLTGVIRTAVQDVRRLTEPYQQELKAATTKAEATARIHHLRQHLLIDADIDAIGPGRKSTLAMHGIETAADIDAAEIRKIKGFGESYTARLVAWRRSVERSFRFNPRAGAPSAGLRTLAVKYRAQQTQVLSELTGHLSALEGLADGCRAALDRLRPTILAAVADYEQARADLAVAQAA